MKKIYTILLIVASLGAFLGVAQASPTTLPVKFSTRTVQATEDPVPGEWTAAAYWDLRTKTAAGVVLRRIGLIKQPLGFDFDLEVDGFAGADMDANILGGVSIGKTLHVAQNVDFKFGIAGTFSQNKPTGVGLLLGLGVRF